MEQRFAITSVRSDAELAFTGFEGDYFTVELHGSEVSAIRRIWGYTDCQLLVELLNHLAKQDRGWTDAAEWTSIESDLALRFRSDALGHVFVEVEMAHYRGAEDWHLKSEIETELGQLPRLAASAAAFFNLNSRI